MQWSRTKRPKQGERNTTIEQQKRERVYKSMKWRIVLRVFTRGVYKNMKWRIVLRVFTRV